jgi:Ca-activated chloride channel family protein
MRFFILGLSGSLAACLNKEPKQETTILEMNQDEQAEIFESMPEETTESISIEEVSAEMSKPNDSKSKASEEPMESIQKSKSATSLIKTKKTDITNKEALVDDLLDEQKFISKNLSEVGKVGKVGEVGLRGVGLGGGGLGGVGGKHGSPQGRIGYRSAIGDADNHNSFSSHHNTEEYKDHGVNEFTQSTKDAHSTFSIDVDTASFTIARKKLNAGIFPPLSSVRTEEFINYFPYGYRAPQKDVFHIDMKAFVDPLRADHTYLRVGLKAKEYTRKTRPPLNLSFLVDVSGSMSSQDKLPLAQKSMELLLESLRPDDTVSISTYAGRTALILPATKGDNKEAILAAIQSMESGGSTAMSSGIDIAYKQVWKHFDPTKENRVIILSDGDANVGNTSQDALISQLKSYADRGVTLSTIGFGMGNYKDNRMEQLANKGDGNSYYIDSTKEARRIFVEGFNSTMISVARDVKIQVEFDPTVVSSYRLIGYENRDIADKDFRNDRVDAGEVGAGHSVTALYELKPTGAKGPIATTRLRYEAPGKDSTATERVYQLSSTKIQKNPSKDLKLAYAASTFAEILRKSPYVHDINLGQLLRYAEQEKLSKDLLDVLKKAQSIERTTVSIKQ